MSFAVNKRDSKHMEVYMNVENVLVGALRPYAGNARTHSKKQIRQIAKSIQRFGFNNPVLVDDSLQVIAGHGRVAAAKLLGIEVDGSIHEIFMDWRHTAEMIAAGRQVYSELKNLCVWAKTNAGMGTFYRSQHEFVFVWKNGSAPHVNAFELGQHGRSRSNLWTYAGANTVKPGRLHELAMHPTVKPVALVADAIRDCSRRNDLVLDPFAGSGTILIAADRTGRKARALEIDPNYVDVAVRRWQSYTGKVATLFATGETFEDVGERRQSTSMAA
jgi:hypothetical protein